MTLDDLDIRILIELQKDSNINVNTLSKKLNLSKTPIYDRIRKLEDLGVIKKYVALVDSQLLEPKVIVFCSVSLESQKLSEIEKFGKEIACVPEVVECYLMGGANDFLLKVIVKDLKDYHRFSSGILATLPNVGQIKSTFVLNEIKHTTAYPIGL